jgi:hypothetical protein
MQLRCNLPSIKRFCSKRNQSGRVLVSWNLLNTINVRTLVAKKEKKNVIQERKGGLWFRETHTLYCANDAACASRAWLRC